MAMPLRPELQTVVERLLREHAGEVPLDAIGEALGVQAVSTEEVEAIFVALESEGREVGGGQPGAARASLKRVIDAARALKLESSRRPTLDEVAARAGLTRDEALDGLFLLRVMQR